MSAPVNTPAAVVGANPFNLRVVFALVLVGALAFVGLLWALGQGLEGKDANDGGGHGAGTGLNGYAALVQLLEKQGYPVRRLRQESDLKAPGLVVLTPPLGTDGEKIARIIDERRYRGPTVLVLPKWQAIPATMIDKSARKGWVLMGEPAVPGWAADLAAYSVTPRLVSASSWQGPGDSGKLASAKALAITGTSWVSLVRADNGAVLAAYLQDNGYYPDLAHAGGAEPVGEDEDLFPVLLVADPDLIDNWGMADRDRAMNALNLIALASGGRRDAVAFDLTLNGLGASQNLLTLAFRPPFLAATLCLIVAALLVAWRGFVRFGPPLAAVRAIAFGKRALVGSAAALIRRSGRLHLLGPPYAAMLRDRLARTLALPRHADPAATEAAIDRALATRDPLAPPFSQLAAQLRAARRPAELLRAGQALHALERTLTR